MTCSKLVILHASWQQSVSPHLLNPSARVHHMGINRRMMKRLFLGENRLARVPLGRSNSYSYINAKTPESLSSAELLLFQSCFSLTTTTPIAAPYKRVTAPLSVLLFLTRRPQRPWTQVEGPSTVDACFLRDITYARLSVLAFGKHSLS